MADEEKKPEEAKTAAPDKKDAENTEGMKAESDTASSITSVDLKPKKGLLRAKIYTPFETFFDGDAKSVTAANETGKFDILPGHKNFITMLLPGDVVVMPAGDKKEPKVIPIARGLMHIKEDKVIIFLDV